MGAQGINSFDAVIGTLALLAAVMGYSTGLLRSMATIFGYLAAAPVAVAATPLVAPLVVGAPSAHQPQQWIVFCGVLIIAGIVLGGLLRTALGAVVGPHISLPDRLAGAMLGATRIGLVAVALVLVFDRIIPPHLQPQFLAQSRLRPILATAAAAGVKSLPPEVERYIERLKRSRGF
ncbi:MAG: CvpA family protein [Xanthobacteraceae bacterium]